MKKILIWNVLVIALLLLFAKGVIAEDKLTIPPISLQDKIDYYADKWGVDSQDLRKVIRCESNYNVNAVNWQDSHKLSKGSHGISQFSKETIAMYGKQIGIENPDPYNPDDALNVMAYMFSTGKQNHWTCSRHL